MRYRVLGRIAYEHLSDADASANRVSWEDAVAIIRDAQDTEKVRAKKAATSKESAHKNEEALAYLDDLRVNTGIIAIEQQGETLRFIHLTFCEFMAAHYISQYVADGIDALCRLQQQFDALNNAATRSRFDQVIPFALALVRPVDQPQALDAMERIVSDNVLAAIFLETKAYSHPAWLRFYGRVMQLLAELAASPDPGDIAADMHMLTVLVNDAATHGAVTEIDGRSFEEQLVMLSKGDGVFLRRLLEGLSGYDAVAAFRVAQACGLAPLHQAPDFVRRGFEQPAFALFALDQMRQDTGHRGDWITLALEAGLAFSAANQIFRQSELPARVKGVSAPARRQSWTRYIGSNLLGWLFDQAYYNNSIADRKIVRAFRKFPKPSIFIPAINLAYQITKSGSGNFISMSRMYSLLLITTSILIPIIKYLQLESIIGNDKLLNELMLNSWQEVILKSSFTAMIAVMLFMPWLMKRWATRFFLRVSYIFKGVSLNKLGISTTKLPGLFRIINIYRSIEDAVDILAKEIVNVRRLDVS
jgi:hypothetical protein